MTEIQDEIFLVKRTPGEPPEDGEMSEVTLPSRHRIYNSNPGGLRPNTLPLGHGGSPKYCVSRVDGEETFFVSFKPPGPGNEPRTLVWKVAVLTASPVMFIVIVRGSTRFKPGTHATLATQVLYQSVPSPSLIWLPSEYETLTQCWINVGTPSPTMDQH